MPIWNNRPAFVYFIRAKGTPERIKIGCSADPVRRAAEISRWAPFELEIAATIPGHVALEQRFHALFRHLHTHHEWFDTDAALEAVIGKINAGTFDVDSLPRGWRLYNEAPPPVRKQAA